MVRFSAPGMDVLEMHYEPDSAASTSGALLGLPGHSIVACPTLEETCVDLRTLNK